MKIRNILNILLVLTCITALTISAADRKRAGGPKGGRLLETEPKAEFLLEKDHTVTVTFYDSALQPVAVHAQTVTVIAGANGTKTKVEFEKKGEVLVSKAKLPEGGDYNVVVQLKQTPEAKSQNFRFKLDLHTCGECKRPEYACICDE